jgi:hypothetical protein
MANWNYYVEQQAGHFPREVHDDGFAMAQIDTLYTRDVAGDYRERFFSGFDAYMIDIYGYSVYDYWDWDDFRAWYGSA